MAGPIVVAVGDKGLSAPLAAMVARLAGTGQRQQAGVTVIHVAKVWGTSLGLQHPSLQPNAAERGAAQQIAARAVHELRGRGVAAEALVISGRDAGKALAAAARRAGAGTIVVGRGRRGRLDRLLRGPDAARTLLNRAPCTVVVVDG